MPQPIQISGSSKPRRALLKREKCAVLIATIMAEWAYVEDVLTLMFSGCMGTHNITKEGGFSLNRNWVALSTTESLDNNFMRLKIVDNVLAVFLKDDLDTKWNDIKKVY
jgi:hypothetical protein